MSDWNNKKNDLTWKLFAEGYTSQNHPEYVRWYANIHEFEYTPEFVRKMVLESPCGLLMKGTDFCGYMSYMGIDWRLENNNSVHRCPHSKADCELNHEHLRKAIGHKGNMVQCAFHTTDKAYDYGKSYEKVWDEFYAMQERKKTEFYRRLKWNPDERHCNCIRWDDLKQDWFARYDPLDCAHGCYVRDVCVLTGKRLDGKKGNVFYDVKITRVRHDGGLWEGEKVVNIQKGKKMFDNPKPLAICEASARRCKEWIVDREISRFHRELFFNPDTTIEVMNIRAEYRESRDILQDLRDVAEGIKVTHASDEMKKIATAKKERRKKYQADKRRLREKKNIAKWKRLLKDDEFACNYSHERGLDFELMRHHAEKELKKRGVVVEKTEQVSMFGGNAN
jgi:hypothetical protein